ncbi:PREDICTED: UDP-glucuronosyltransferase 2B31-like isoform X1 [Priapulus caudatus]|uniref:UDP-glucuronosyltransferase 2B31-like isoform X1 n=1 Tax=Priapulus caudatus TaxID=37621 RepID=A0ABM1EB67_PRICU|nr:PREDICTED: UDP-glucuronosyltransferase 2B31-like isoform X1 [Priapulus caudatus]
MTSLTCEASQQTFNASLSTKTNAMRRWYLLKFGKWLSMFTAISAYNEKRFCDQIVMEPGLLGKIKDGGFDYVIIDHVDACGRLLANYVGKPFAIVHSFPTNTILYGEGGSPLVLSYTPTHGMYRTTHFSDKMTFLESVHNVLHYVIHKVLVHVTLERTMNAFGWSHGLLQSHERYERITDRAALVLFSSNPAFDHPRPTMPHVQHTGGQLCQPLKALPQKLDDLLARTNRKVIYMSFGTLLHGPGGLNENQRFKTALLGAVSNLPYLFIIANFNMTGLPTNVVTLEWAPQNDLLGHSKVASFITHGGINGLWQAICHATPVVVMPIFADQFRNAHMAQERGIGEMIDFHTITTESLQSALRRVVENDAYAARVRQLSKLYHHSLPMSPDETVSFWVNYTMLYADQQAPAYTELNFLQYWLIDVIACLLVIAAFFAWLTYVVLIASISISTRVIRRCCRRSIRNIISA